MNSFLKKTLVILFGFAWSASTSAGGSQLSSSDLKVYAPIEGSNTTAAYGIFKNTSKKEVTLKAIAGAPFKAVETHRTISKDGVSKMEKIDVVTIKPGESFVMQPGGNHIMLFDATKKVTDGEKLDLVFEVDGKKTHFFFEVTSREKQSANHNH